MKLSLHYLAINLMSSKLSINYSFNYSKSRLRSEKDVKITKPVKILHPTNLILLPLLQSIDNQV